MGKKTKLFFKLMSVVLILTLVTVAFVPWRSLVETEIKKQLSKQNLNVDSLNVTALSHKGIVIENFNINEGALIFKKLKIKTTADSLMNKSIESLELDGLKIEKEKLLASFSPKKEKEISTNSQNLQELIQSIPSSSLNFSLNSLNGLHPELDSGDFPTSIQFNKSRNELMIKIRQGHIKEFKTLKNVFIDTEIVFKVSNNHVEVNLKNFDMSLPDKVISLDPNTEIKIDLDKSNDLSIEKLDANFNLDMELNDENAYLNKINSKNKIMLKDGRYLIKTLVSHPEKTAILKLEGWLEEKNTQNGSFAIDLLVKDLTKEKLIKTSPALAIYVQEIEGQLELKGVVKMSDERIIPSLTLIGEQLSFQYEESKIKGLNFKHHLSSLKSYGSYKQNVFSIDEIDVGLIIKNFNTEYKVLNKNKIDVKSISFSTFDGLIRADHFSIINNQPKNLTVKLKKFPLSKFLNMALKDGVEATGEIEGELPIAYKNNKPIVKNGRLKNSGKGIIKYDPGRANPLKSMNQMQVNILLKYLKDFSYNQLLIDAHSDEEYNLILNSKFTGTNPDAYNGRPLKLGVNLDFNVKDAIISKMMFMKIPEKIEERLIREMEK
jgi:hypothetical protein